jgi:hypothetical protein
MELSGQLHILATLSPGKVSSTHWVGGSVGPRAGLDVVGKKKIPSHNRNWTPVIQPIAFSLYWLSYPASVDQPILSEMLTSCGHCVKPWSSTCHKILNCFDFPDYFNAVLKISDTLILLIALLGCRTWYLTEEHILQVFRY